MQTLYLPYGAHQHKHAQKKETKPVKSVKHINDCCPEYKRVNLTSNVIGLAEQKNANVVGPYDIVILNSIAWVSTSANGGSILRLDGCGVEVAAPVLVAAVSGLTVNMSPGFTFTNTAGQVVRSEVLFGTRDGRVGGVAGNEAKFFNESIGADYRGVAQFGNLLYAADASGLGKVDVYDSNGVLKGSIPNTVGVVGYRPCNVANYFGQLLIAYSNDVVGSQPGNGYIDIVHQPETFALTPAPTVTVAHRLISREPLNGPFAMIPFNCGKQLLVSNKFDGLIHIFDIEKRLTHIQRGIYQACHNPYIVPTSTVSPAYAKSVPYEPVLDNLALCDTPLQIGGLGGLASENVTYACGYGQKNFYAQQLRPIAVQPYLISSFWTGRQEWSDSSKGSAADCHSSSVSASSSASCKPSPSCDSKSHCDDSVVNQECLIKKHCDSDSGSRPTPIWFVAAFDQGVNGVIGKLFLVEKEEEEDHAVRAEEHYDAKKEHKATSHKHKTTYVVSSST